MLAKPKGRKTLRVEPEIWEDAVISAVKRQNMAKSIDVRFSLQGQIREDKQTESFVAYCPALDLYSAGQTRPDAKRALESAVDMFVQICFSRNILGRVLHEKGFGVVAASEVPATGLAENFITITETETTHGEQYDDTFPIEVPLHLLAGMTNKKQAEGCLQ